MLEAFLRAYLGTGGSNQFYVTLEGKMCTAGKAAASQFNGEGTHASSSSGSPKARAISYLVLPPDPRKTKAMAVYMLNEEKTMFSWGNPFETKSLARFTAKDEVLFCSSYGVKVQVRVSWGGNVSGL